MAEASVVVTVTDVMPLAGKGVIVHGTLAVDASSDEYAAGGLDLGKTEFGAKSPATPGTPLQLFAKGIAGYVYEWDRANEHLLIRESAGSNTVLSEIATSAIPSGVSGDTISFIALFAKLSSD